MPSNNPKIMIEYIQDIISRKNLDNVSNSAMKFVKENYDYNQAVESWSSAIESIN